MELLNDAATILNSVEKTLVQASKAAIEQKEPVVRTARDLVIAERVNELGVKLARTADEIAEDQNLPNDVEIEADTSLEVKVPVVEVNSSLPEINGEIAEEFDDDICDIILGEAAVTYTDGVFKRGYYPKICNGFVEEKCK